MSRPPVSEITTISDLLAAHRRGDLKDVVVTVDNDHIFAYRIGDDEEGEDDEWVFSFDGNPQCLLVELLNQIGIEADQA